MNLKHRMAGLCASGVFLLTALPGFYQHVKPTDINQISNDVLSGMSIMETLLLSAGGAILAGFIGHQMGNILENPKGSPRRKRQKPAPPTRPAPSRELSRPDTPPAIPENTEEASLAAASEDLAPEGSEAEEAASSVE